MQPMASLMDIVEFILSKMEDTQGQGREFREEKEIKDTEQNRELMGERVGWQGLCARPLVEELAWKDTSKVLPHGIEGTVV